MKLGDSSIRNTVFILTLSSLALASFSLRAEIYKWKDAKGVTQYSDKPPLSITAKPESSQLKAILAAQVMCSASENPKNASASSVYAAATKNEMASFALPTLAKPTGPQVSVPEPYAGVQIFRNPVVVAQAPVVTAPVVTAPVVTAPVVTAPVVTAPVVTAPVVTTPVASNMNSGAMNMPVVDIKKIPVGVTGKNFIDLIAQQYPPVKEAGNFTNGDFRIRCDYSHMLNDDPIVKPNQPGASHLHTFFGNSGANASSTNESLMKTGTSTCDGGVMNRSAYWVPTVIDTRSATPIAPSGGNFYYKTGDATNIKMPPIGLRMIAGDMKASSIQPDNKLVWWCGDKNDNNVSGNLGYIPACAVGNHLMAIVRFPNFWDGVNLDSATHKSHVSYIHDSAHPVMIPDITFNIRYDINPGDDTTKWRLSSDMYSTSIPGGYSLHGDYMFGWTNDPKTGKNFAQIFTDECLKTALNCGNTLLGDGRQFYY